MTRSVIPTISPPRGRHSRNFNASFVVRGGAFETMEGSARDRNVVVEFKNRETALACYHSAEYRAARAIRQKYAEADFIIIDGAS